MTQKQHHIIPSPGRRESDQEYQSLVTELKSLLSKGLYQAYKAVDNIKVQTYWQIGERIVREELKYKDRADYGRYLIDNLAVDLTLPKRRLYEIVKFYRVYAIMRSVTAQLSWTHYVQLLEIENDKKRRFYEQKTVLHSWSVRELRQQLKSGLYENTPQKDIDEVFNPKLPSVEPNEIFKDTYN